MTNKFTQHSWNSCYLSRNSGISGKKYLFPARFPDTGMSSLFIDVFSRQCFFSGIAPALLSKASSNCLHNLLYTPLSAPTKQAYIFHITTIPLHLLPFHLPDETLPFNKVSFPLDKETFPLAFGTFPLAFGTFPLASGTFPVDVVTIPLDKVPFPLAFGTFPVGFGTFPVDVGTFPIDNATIRLDKGSFPGRKGTFPLAACSFPLANGTIPLDAGSFPIDVVTSSGNLQFFLSEKRLFL